MKYVLLTLASLVFIISCTPGKSGKQNAIDSLSQGSLEAPEDASRSMRKLYNLREELLSEYNKAPNDIAKEDLLNKYKAKLHSYLFDSCKLIMDSMKVEVTELKPLASKLYKARFQMPVAEFSSTINFKDDADLQKDSLYNFIKGLSEYSDTTMRLFYLGECTVNDPTGYLKTFEIEVIPASIKSKINIPKDRKP